MKKNTLKKNKIKTSYINYFKIEYKNTRSMKNLRYFCSSQYNGIIQKHKNPNIIKKNIHRFNIFLTHIYLTI